MWATRNCLIRHNEGLRIDLRIQKRRGNYAEL
jgi:hypothetical protein